MHSISSRELDWQRPRRNAVGAPYLEPDEERSLLMRAAGDPDAMSTLIESHMRLVVRIAHNYARGGVPAEDLIAEGTLGLLEAIRRFDVRADTRLSTYAKWWIASRVRAYSLANRRLVPLPSTRAARRALAKLTSAERNLTRELGRAPRREELAERLAISLEDLDDWLMAWTAHDLSVSQDDQPTSMDPCDVDADPEHTAAEAERRQQFQAALNKTLANLGPRQRRVLEAQLSGDEDTTLRELGLELGVTRQRASQMAAWVRERVRANLALPASEAPAR